MRDVEHVQVEEHDHVKPVQQLEHEERTVEILEQPDQHRGGGRMLDEAPTRHPPDHLRRMRDEALRRLVDFHFVNGVLWQVHAVTPTIKLRCTVTFCLLLRAHHLCNDLCCNS